MNAQFPDKLQFLFEPARYKVAYGGRGGTKSWGFARALLIMGAQRPMQVLCARELQNSIDESVHKLLELQVDALGLSGCYDVQARRIVGRNGSEFIFEGLRHNVSRIKSYEGVDIVWVEEAQAVSKNSWEVLIPTIRKPGSEIWVSFNPDFEDDDTYQRFVAHPPHRSVVQEIGWRDNPWFPAELEEERQTLLARSQSDYDHVWEGRCRRWLEGAIYAEELRAAYEDKRVCAVAHDPALPVYTAWDIGHTDDTCILWYQLVHDEVHVLEGYALSGGSLSHFASQVLGVEVEITISPRNGVTVSKGGPLPGLEHRRAYRYAQHWLPPDAKAKLLAAGGRSVERQLKTALGATVRSIRNTSSVEHGIQALRSLFSRCWFDESGCYDLLRALRSYQRRVQADEVSLARSPLHNWASNYADAARYMAVKVQAPPEQAAAPEPELDAWGKPLIEEWSWKVA